jgi:hypothetical protein
VVDAATAAEFGDRLDIRRLRPTITFPVQVLAPPGRRMSLLAERFLALVRSEACHAGHPVRGSREKDLQPDTPAADLQRAGALAVAKGSILDVHHTIRRNPWCRTRRFFYSAACLWKRLFSIAVRSSGRRK